VQRLQHGLRVGFRDTQECTGGAFGTAVALFPDLEGAGADADERGKLNLAVNDGGLSNPDRRAKRWLCATRPQFLGFTSSPRLPPAADKSARRGRRALP